MLFPIVELLSGLVLLLTVACLRGVYLVCLDTMVRLPSAGRSTPKLSIGAGTGFLIGAGAFPAVTFTYDPTGVTIYGSSVAFTTIAMPNASEISALWDLLSIDKVEITMQSVYDPSVSTNTYVPRMMICNDFNSGATGTSTQAISEHADAKALMSTYNKWNVKPKYQRVIFYNAVTSSYEPATGFVNSDTAIPHYGTHLGIFDSGSIAGGDLLLSFKFFLRAKNVK